MRGVAVVLLGMVLGLSGCVVYDDGDGYDGRRYEHWDGEREHRHYHRRDDDGYRREHWDGERRHERRWDDDERR